MSDKRTVFITSDWHLGGSADVQGEDGRIKPGSSICRSSKAITQFIDWITSQVAGAPHPVELVVNGDIVDFLAPDDGYVPRAWLSDETLAAKRFLQIADSSCIDGRGPFEALKYFLASGGELTFLLGNHDLEMSLPAVRSALTARLNSLGKKFTFIYDGEAHVRGRLLIEHGNRYDPLNVIDYSRLRQERSHLSRGFHCLEAERDKNYFLPPYGSELVANIFNPILPQVPFLNLLKPEMEAALPLVLALCPESRKLIQAGIQLYKIQKYTYVNRLRREAQPRNPGQLASGHDETYRSLDAVLGDALGDDAHAFKVVDRQGGNLSASRSAAAQLSELAAKGRELAQRAAFGASVAELLAPQTDERRLAQVEIVLRRVRDEANWGLQMEAETYAHAAKTLMREGNFSVIVFGHTHFPKHVSFSEGTYFNTGTWADTMRLPPPQSGEGREAQIKSFVEGIQKQSLQQFRVRRLTYVEANVGTTGEVKAILHQFRSACQPRTDVDTL